MMLTSKDGEAAGADEMGTGIYQPAFTFLLLAIFYVYNTDEESGCRPQEVIDANKRLKELNDELHLSNAQLKGGQPQHCRKLLSEGGVYRPLYGPVLGLFGKRWTNYRRSLGKIAATGNVEELYKNIKSSKFIEGN